MKKFFNNLINISLILLLLLMPINAVLAANTHSTDLERDSSQAWSITNGDQTGLGMSNDVSVEAWVKRESIGNYMGVMRKRAGSGGYYTLYFDSDNILTFAYNDGSNVTQKHANTAITTTEWVHLAVVADVSEIDIFFYVNGSPVAFTSDANYANSMSTNTGDFVIGAMYSAGPANYIDGLVDEVRVWDDVRTAQEIADNYQQELVGNEPGLVGYWKFNNDAGVGYANSNDLTNNNTATFSTEIPFGAGEVDESQAI